MTDVLLVEDEEVVALFVRVSLEDVGLRVEAHTKAAGALPALERNRYRLAIFDIGLPDIRGDTLALRARELHAGLPIILASGMSGIALAPVIQADPLMHFLEKPFDVKELLDALRIVGVHTES